MRSFERSISSCQPLLSAYADSSPLRHHLRNPLIPFSAWHIARSKSLQMAGRNDVPSRRVEHCIREFPPAEGRSNWRPIVLWPRTSLSTSDETKSHLDRPPKQASTRHVSLSSRELPCVFVWSGDGRWPVPTYCREQKTLSIRFGRNTTWRLEVPLASEGSILGAEADFDMRNAMLPDQCTSWRRSRCIHAEECHVRSIYFFKRSHR